jgi:SNF2 family DNA or RNA helicase
MINDTYPTGLRPLQVSGALKIFSRRRMLLADQPGSGKTAQALVALELDGLLTKPSAILILCNVTGCQLTWASELERRVASQYEVVIADLTDTKGKKTMPSVAARNNELGVKMLEATDLDLPLIVLANYDLLRWRPGTAPKMLNLFSIVFDAVVIDEAHLVLPTRDDHQKKLTLFWYGLSKLPMSATAIRLPMSGTPDRGELANRYGTWKFMHPESHTSYWSWARSHFVITPNNWGGMDIGKLRAPENWAGYERQHMIRRTKAEMLKGLPAKQWANDGGVDLPMTVLQEDAYYDYMADLEAKERELIANDEGGKAQALKMQFALRARQMATCTWTFIEAMGADGKMHTHGKPIVAGPDASNKLAWILDWLEARGYTKANWDPTLGKVVIVSYFTEALHWLHAELANAGIASAVMAGDTSAVDKKRIEHEFQQGSVRIVLLSGWLGVSINLDAADDMIFTDIHYDPDRNEQVEDRIHRASRNHQVTYWRLVSQNTADQVVLAASDSRYRGTRSMYEGARGIEFARRFLPRNMIMEES